MSLWDEFSGDLVGSLSRKIDNQLNNEYETAPAATYSSAPVVLDARGRAKEAATNPEILGGVSNGMLIGGGVAVVGLIVLLAVIR